MNRSIFNESGDCGYILKPREMRECMNDKCIKNELINDKCMNDECMNEPWWL